MENQEQPQEEVKEKQPEETVEELKQRLENARIENQRKTAELQKAREDAEAARAPQSQPVNEDPAQILNRWADHELKAFLKDPTNAHLHDKAEEILQRRRFDRYENEKSEKHIRLNTELERQNKYPETFDPTHPMAVKMSELMRSYRLENTPAGRLVAARLAHVEVEQQKAAAAARKAEQDRQADVNANFGGGSRPAPKASDKAKLAELKQKAMQGDKAAQAEWFKVRGLI